MHNVESPETPFSVLFSRLPKGQIVRVFENHVLATTAPMLIVYDNACHLFSYAMNREAWFFRHTMIVIDRLHR